MLSKFNAEDILIYGSLGFFGGIARLIHILKRLKDDEHIHYAEYLNLLLISPVMAILAGLYANEHELGTATYAIAFFIGVSSLNIIGKVIDGGISGILDILKGKA